MNELTVIKKHGKIKNVILYFFIYSFIGWCLETIYAFFVEGKFVNRGFLLGPLCPIYGFGAIFLIFLLRNCKGKPMTEFLIAAFAFTAFEYVVSYVLEAVFGLRWWDYSNDFLNIQGRVSLAYTIVWGALGILLMEGIHPNIKRLTDKIKNHLKPSYQDIIIIALIVVCIADCILSSIKYLKI